MVYTRSLEGIVNRGTAQARRASLALLGIDSDGNVSRSSRMQLLMIQSATLAVIDANDPFEEQTESALATALYAAEGGFYGNPAFQQEGAGTIDTGRGRFVIFGALNSSKTKFTVMTMAQLRALFTQDTSATSHKSFYVGMTFDLDTVAEMEEIRIDNVAEDPDVGVVIVDAIKAFAV